METPTPVDLNRLKNILGNAKKIMKAADEKFSEKKPSKHIVEGHSSNYQTPFYDEQDEKELTYQTPELSHLQDVRDYTEEDIINSKLPLNVKEAMIKNPIPKPSMSFSKFNLDGLEELVDKPTSKPSYKQPIREVQSSIGSDIITISKTELNEIIDNRVNSIIATMFTKTITEQAIKKTVNTLINEGKLIRKK